MKYLCFRFATEGDDLDAQIAKGQQDFWASHVEVLSGLHRASLALRFNDEVDRWQWTNSPVEWKREATCALKVSDAQGRRFIGFLDKHVVGKPYDMRCLAGVKYELIAHDYKKWNCSDFIYLGLSYVGVIRYVPPGLWHITPRDLMLLLFALGSPEPF